MIIKILKILTLYKDLTLTIQIEYPNFRLLKRRLLETSFFLLNFIINFMKKTLTFLFLSALAVYISGCAMAGAPVNGSLFSDVKGPVLITSESGGTKTGEATCTSILGLLATGDCSIAAAKKQGGITTVSHVDHHSTNLLGVLATYKTVVTGK